MILQLRPTQAFHLHIEQNTGDLAAQWRIEDFLCRSIQRNPVAARAQQFANCGPKRGVVIDDVNYRRRFRHEAIALDNGKVKRNIAPPPGRFSAHIFPP